MTCSDLDFKWISLAARVLRIECMCAKMDVMMLIRRLL